MAKSAFNSRVVNRTQPTKVIFLSCSLGPSVPSVGIGKELNDSRDNGPSLPGLLSAVSNRAVVQSAPEDNSDYSPWTDLRTVAIFLGSWS